MKPDLLQSHGVAPNGGGQIGREGEGEFAALFRGPGAENSGDVRVGRWQGKGDGLEVEFAAFDVREIAEVVPPPSEDVGGRGSDFDLARLGGLRPGFSPRGAGGPVLRARKSTATAAGGPQSGAWR